MKRDQRYLMEKHGGGSPPLDLAAGLGLGLLFALAAGAVSAVISLL